MTVSIKQVFLFTLNPGPPGRPSRPGSPATPLGPAGPGPPRSPGGPYVVKKKKQHVCKSAFVDLDIDDTGVAARELLFFFFFYL